MMYDEFCRVSCRNLKLLRFLSGRTQDEIAKSLHVSRSTYGALEQGKQAMSFFTACQLAEFYSLEVGALLQVELLLEKFLPEMGEKTGTKRCDSVLKTRF